MPTAAIKQMVGEMCRLQKHGGPDDEGIYEYEKQHLVLGHRRLALIDLSAAGHQPMMYGNRYVISFNGEIYNYPQLKTELQQLGNSFTTNCDTEVILAAFSQWHVQSFAKLKGMFAFALFDKLKEELFLVRDPAGIKPLYYSIKGQSLEFASETKAFVSETSKKINKSWPVFQLAYGHLPEPVTTLQNVQPLHKGCFIKYNLGNHTHSLQSFTHYSYSSTISNRQQAQQLLQQHIGKAVKRHLLADAPIGVFLSGGIDSSIITTVSAAHQQQQLTTLSVYFREAVFSEKNYQDILIKKLQCNNYQHLLKEEEFHQSFPSILHAMDMPSCDGINTWFISKYAANRGLKAVLSGIGGDELFGGYPSFKRMALTNLLQASPSFLLSAVRSRKHKKIRRLQYLKINGIKGRYLFLRGQFVPIEIAQQLDATEKEVWEILKEHPTYGPLNGIDAKNQAGWMEMNLYMQNQLLRDADVMSMAHGVEIRVPLLDDEVIKTSLAISNPVKYAGNFNKQLLIDAFKKELPQEIWNRPKMGFSFPFTEWLANSAYVKDLMMAADKNTKRSYRLFLQGRLHWSHIMSLVILKNKAIAW
ncbi:MAG: asparagine synthase (glutamine-hydrolyzing) [Bacteroidetes bacterium]|nr:asparagine synthase (glutamine-hydrolyzing) [Bacteroidota bacterium]